MILPAFVWNHSTHSHSRSSDTNALSFAPRVTTHEGKFRHKHHGVSFRKRPNTFGFAGGANSDFLGESRLCLSYLGHMTNATLWLK